MKDWLMPSPDPILDQNQFGCRPGRSTTHAVVAVLQKWIEIFDKRGSVRAVFIDYRKAFHIVNHVTLLSRSEYVIQIPITTPQVLVIFTLLLSQISDYLCSNFVNSNHGLSRLVR